MKSAVFAFLTLIFCASNSMHAAGTLVPSVDGITVYDSANGVTWLANFNLPATNRFGLSLCTPAGIEPCVNASGAMSYQSAAAWVKAMNAANYLGHSNWQIPTTPIFDAGCSFTGPQNNSFGWNCSASALGSVYYTALGLSAPNTAVPASTLKAGPFINFQPDLYWSQTSLPQPTGDVGCCGTFSFNSGWQGSNIAPNFLFVLPMIPGKIAGTPAATGTGLQVNPGGQTVYDPIANVTWLANANLAASNTFGLPACKAPGSPAVCVSGNGAMNWVSSDQFVKNMNAAAYLGQTNWQVPPVDPNCGAGYVCTVTTAPFQSLFYTQLGLTPGAEVVTEPDVAVGPFTGVRPYLYWTCGGTTVASLCSTPPAPGFEWSFWFSNGFEGTDVLAHDMYVTAYFPGTRTATTGPQITEVANAEGESATIAPNTWVEIKGLNLAPAGDSRIWQASDFAGNTMPTQLDRVSATVNGKSAFVYYISPTQVNILTPPDAISGPVQVVVTNNAIPTAAFTAQAQPTSASFFVFNGGPYVAATHLDGSLIGPATLYPGASTPAKPGETVVVYGNGFGPTTVAVVSGSAAQSGTLSPTPVVQIGGVKATVLFAGLVAPGEFQFNVQIPATAVNGDQAITVTSAIGPVQSGVLITVHN